MEHAPLLFASGLLAGAMNAAAGGGSFVTLPALLSAGLSPVTANASSTVALFPGSLTSAWAFRRDFAPLAGVDLGRLFAVSVAGGMAGALLLLATPQKAFLAAVPWLMLAGALAFAFGRGLGERIGRTVRFGAGAVLCVQFGLGVYGGYFGGAVGLLMMAVWSLLGSSDIKSMNAAKALLVGAANSVAVACFALAGVVSWPQTAVMLGAAALGGYAGARVARGLAPGGIRKGIAACNFVMTALVFWRAFG